jgi:hypothetical protein
VALPTRREKAAPYFAPALGYIYNDLAQNGWAEAFQAVNGDSNLPSVMIDPHYHPLRNPGE